MKKKLLARPWMCLETSWGRLEWFWRRLGAIGRYLGDVLGALGGVLGALLHILEVSLRSLWTMICQDLDRNPRNTKTSRKPKKSIVLMPGTITGHCEANAGHGRNQ